MERINHFKSKNLSIIFFVILLFSSFILNFSNSQDIPNEIKIIKFNCILNSSHGEYNLSDYYEHIDFIVKRNSSISNHEQQLNSILFINTSNNDPINFYARNKISSYEPILFYNLTNISSLNQNPIVNIAMEDYFLIWELDIIDSINYKKINISIVHNETYSFYLFYAQYLNQYPIRFFTLKYEALNITIQYNNVFPINLIFMPNGTYNYIQLNLSQFLTKSTIKFYKNFIKNGQPYTLPPYNFVFEYSIFTNRNRKKLFIILSSYDNLLEINLMVLKDTEYIMRFGISDNNETYFFPYEYKLTKDNYNINLDLLSFFGLIEIEVEKRTTYNFRTKLIAEIEIDSTNFKFEFDQFNIFSSNFLKKIYFVPVGFYRFKLYCQPKNSPIDIYDYIFIPLDQFIGISNRIYIGHTIANATNIISYVKINLLEFKFFKLEFYFNGELFNGAIPELDKNTNQIYYNYGKVGDSITFPFEGVENLIISNYRDDETYEIDLEKYGYNVKFVNLEQNIYCSNFRIKDSLDILMVFSTINMICSTVDNTKYIRINGSPGEIITIEKEDFIDYYYLI